MDVRLQQSTVFTGNYVCFNVVKDPEDSLFKCWYEDVQNYFGLRGGTGLTDARVCYAQSSDGLNWEKPSLGKRCIEGCDTSVVLDLSPEARARTQTIILDGLEENSARRYKMMHVHYVKRERPPDGLRADAHSVPAQGLYGIGMSMQFSKNGIDWTPFEGNPVIPYWAGDVEILTFDPIDRKYVLYGLESDDCIHWSEPVMAFEAGTADNLDDGLYGFQFGYS